jgi:hypothetical protein
MTTDIEPINPDLPDNFYLNNLTFHYHSETFTAVLEGCDDNDVVTMQWRNANLQMRAGAIKAILQRDNPT